MNRIMIIVGASLAVLSIEAAGQIGEEPEDDRAMSFETLDQNNDGVLEEGEVMELQDDRDFEGVEFETLDENGDGQVSKEEWVEYFRNN